MFIHIDYNSGEPINRQVIAQIKWKIVSGKLQPGDKLPSIRELARTLKINPTTVTRIYSDLAHNGIIVLRQGQGAFVSEQNVSLPDEEVARVVAEKARTLLVEGIRLGLRKKDIEAIINEEFKKIRTAKDE
jgi:GntR family transcriptional regulator